MSSMTRRTHTPTLMVVVPATNNFLVPLVALAVTMVIWLAARRTKVVAITKAISNPTNSAARNGVRI